MGSYHVYTLGRVCTLRFRRVLFHLHSTDLGHFYREHNHPFAHYTEEEQYTLLATDGMLVKRPILVGEDFVKVGFREKEWNLVQKEK